MLPDQGLNRERYILVGTNSFGVRVTSRTNAGTIILAFGLWPALASLLTSASFAQPDAKTTQLMNEVMLKTKDVSSYRADLKESISGGGRTMTSECALAVKSPDKMHKTTAFNVKGGMKKEEYVIGDIVWTYIPSMKAAQKIDMSKVKKAMSKDVARSSGDIGNPFAGVPKDKTKYVETKTVDNKQFYVFESPISTAAQTAAQKASHPIPHKVVLWIDSATGMRYKTLVYAEDNTLMIEQTYLNYKINVPVPDSEFQFNPPRGVQVKDMTEATISNMRADHKKSEE